MKERLYKLEISLLKILPAILAIFYFINSILTVSAVVSLTFSLISYLSIIPWLFMYLSSFVFKFCKWHRMPLYYIFVNNLFTVCYYFLNISNPLYFIINIIIFGIFVIITSYLKYKHIC